MSPDAPLTTAREALQAGDWTRARDGFEAALADEESPDALAGLGTALWWLQEADRSLELRERAYAAYRRRGQRGLEAVARPRPVACLEGLARRGQRSVGRHDATLRPPTRSATI